MPRRIHLEPHLPVDELQPVEHLWALTNTALANRHFATIEDLEDAQAERCVDLQAGPDLNRSTTLFYWWPRRIMKRQGPRQTQYQPCVVMEDYHPGNVTIVSENRHWRVGGVFDLMTLRFGDGEADLARLGRMYAYEQPRLAQAFIRAYADRKPSRPGFARRFPIYLLHDALIIWAFCIRNNDIWWPEGMMLRGWVEETMEILRAQGLLEE